MLLLWKGGEHEFSLRLGELRALQDACNAGPEEILRRMFANTWRVDDVLSPIRLGLQGGGMAAGEARRLVEAIADAHGLLELKATALTLMVKALKPDEDDPVGEPQGQPSPPANGGGAVSTAPAS